MDMVLTNTSRAAKDASMPMPIFQSKPSGAMTGSSNRPACPAKLRCTRALSLSASNCTNWLVCCHGRERARGVLAKSASRAARWAAKSLRDFRMAGITDQEPEQNVDAQNHRAGPAQKQFRPVPCVAKQQP